MLDLTSPMFLDLHQPKVASSPVRPWQLTCLICLSWRHSCFDDETFACLVSANNAMRLATPWQVLDLRHFIFDRRNTKDCTSCYVKTPSIICFEIHMSSHTCIQLSMTIGVRRTRDDLTWQRTWLLLGRSLMIGWRKKSWNPERVPTVVTLSVCVSVCERATGHTFWPRNAIFGLSDP